MKHPIFASHKHKAIIKDFLTMNKDFVKDVANDTRWQNYLEVLNVVIEYHNNYGKGAKENNYWDWLMIIPINVSILTNGFLAAIETKRNATIVKSYRVVLNEMVQDVVSKIEKLEPINE
mgnify:FL=1|tara:strand:- start:975 stop:1331 length:357 start_codon:yes stop_codon:yes gene_type:complete